MYFQHSVLSPYQGVPVAVLCWTEVSNIPFSSPSRLHSLKPESILPHSESDG